MSRLVEGLSIFLKNLLKNPLVQFAIHPIVDLHMGNYYFLIYKSILINHNIIC